MVRPLDLVLRVLGAQQATSDIKGLGVAGQQAGQAIKQGTAQAWNPFISQLKAADAELKKQVNQSNITARAAIKAAREAKDAVVGAEKDKRQALRETARQMKQQADDAIADAKRLNQAYKDQVRYTNSVQKSAAQQIVTSSPRQGGLQSNVQTIANAERFQAAQQVAGAVSGTFNSARARIDNGVQLAETREAEIATISALAKSEKKGLDIYKDIDQTALKSVFDLEKLTGAGKNLTAGKIYSNRNLRAVDDVAAVGRARGVSPEQTAFALTRLQNGDFGEGFQRFRELGINRSELEAEGLKFSASNQFEGTPEQAVEGVVRAIEKKFGGLSERLATETTSGAVDQLSDAQKRYAAEMQGELLPAINWGARALTVVTNAFADMPGPLKGVWAYTSAAVVGFGQLTGSLISTAATAGQAMLAYNLLKGGTTVAGAGATVAAAQTNTLGVSLFTRLVPGLWASTLAVGKFALAALAIVAVAAAVAYAADKIAHRKEDEALKKNIAAGDATDATRLTRINAERARKGKTEHDRTPLTLEQLRAWEADDSGQMDPLGEQRAPEADLGDIEGLKKQIAGSVGTAPSAQMAFGVMPDVSGAFPSVSPTQTGIRNLEDAVANEPDKDKKKSLREQLRLARRARQDENVMARQMAKEQRARDKALKESNRDDLALAKAENDAEASGQIADLQDALSDAKRDKNASAVRSLTLQIGNIKAEEKFQNRMAAAALKSGASRQKAERAAQIELEADKNRASVAADKAGSAVERANLGGKKKPRLSQDAVDRLFGLFGGANGLSVFKDSVYGSVDGFSALSPGGAAGYGNRFDGLAKSLYNGGQVGGGLSLGIRGIGDFTGASARRAGTQEMTARLKSMRENARGKVRVLFEPLEFDSPNSLANVDVNA